MDKYEKHFILNSVSIDACQLSTNEVLAAVLPLAKEKATGLDNLSTDYLLHASSAI